MDAHALTHSLGGAWRNGQGQAPCPVCQPERRRDQTALSISEANGRILLYCFKSGCSFRDIAQAANLPANSAQIDSVARKEAKRKQTAYVAAKLAKARSLLDYAKPIAETKGEAYLRSRGITGPLNNLWFVSDIYHAPSSTWCSAIIASVEPTGGVHRTFFTKQGQRLAKNAKMMLGPCSGGAVRLSDADGPLVVCEGIETGLSLLSGILDGPHEVWAALSTSGIKALQLPPNPAKLIVATDGDESGKLAGNVLANRAHTLGWDVSLMPAPEGQDWNDVLQSRERAA